MVNKRAQVYLITSLILIMILVAFVTIANYSKKASFSTFLYEAEEIQIESEKMMDYVLISGNESAKDLFVKDVSGYLDEDTRIYFIGGEAGSIKFYNLTNDLPPTRLKIYGDDKIISVVPEKTWYNFSLTEGKHFYFIMIKEKGEEKYVYTNA